MTVARVETRPVERRSLVALWGHRLADRLPGLRKLATAAGALVAFSAPAAACPYCALSQGTETLIYIAAFLGIPYVVVTATMFWMRRVLASEHEG